MCARSILLLGLACVLVRPVFLCMICARLILCVRINMSFGSSVVSVCARSVLFAWVSVCFWSLLRFSLFACVLDTRHLPPAPIFASLPFSAFFYSVLFFSHQLAALAKSSKCKSIGVVLPEACGEGTAQAVAQVYPCTRSRSMMLQERTQYIYIYIYIKKYKQQL